MATTVTLPRNLLRRRLTVSIGAMVCAPALAQPKPATVSPDQTLPLQLSPYPLVYAAVTANGVPCLALLDTGSATPLRISATLAHRLRLQLSPDPRASVQGLDGKRQPVQRGMLDTLQVGQAVMQQIAVEVAGDRIETIAAQVGTAFDVVLGWGFLAQQSFTLDYRLRQWQIGARAGDDAAAIRIAYAVVQRLPVIKTEIDGRETLLLMDTGAPMCNLDITLAGAVAAGSVVSRVLRLGTMERSIEWRVKDLSVPRQALGTVATLGNNLLGQYRVFFDTAAQVMLLD